MMTKYHSKRVFGTPLWAASLLLVGCYAVLFLVGCASETPTESLPTGEEAAEPAWTSGDERVDGLVERLDEALGGRKNWEATRFIRFRFAGRRTHHWDKLEGRHRLETQTRDGDRLVVLLNLNTLQGQVFKNDEEVEGEEKENALQEAYGAWINDTYWLLMPYKLKDPGVSLSYDGEEDIDGQTYDKVLLTFEAVGQTPNDRYWAYLNRDTGLMDRWAYVLQQRDVEGTPPGDAEPKAWDWTGWTRYGKIMLAPGRHGVGNERRLPLDQIAVFESLPDSVFTSPATIESE